MVRRPAAGRRPRRREEVFRCIDAAFAQRRKTLRAALAGWAGSAAAAEAALRAAGVDPSTRGEQLDIAAFARIARPARGSSREPRQRRHVCADGSAHRVRRMTSLRPRPAR